MKSSRAAFAAEALDRRLLLSAAPVLVKDVNPSTASSFPHQFADVNGTLFYAATEGYAKDDLWKSDGTPGGTVRVKDFGPADGPGYAQITDMEAVDGRLFFTAPDPDAANTNQELWASDGTEAGTLRVKDINPGGAASSPEWLTEFGGTLYFAATDAAGGRELWKTDGTESGTVRVRDIISGAGGSDPTNFVVFNGRLYFTARDGSGGRELWSSDGTSGGTSRVHNLNGSDPAVDVTLMREAAGRLYFAVAKGESAYEIWRSDGTSSGTVRLRAGFLGGSDSKPYGLLGVGGTVYFVAEDLATGWELWKSDGTPGGTVLVKDIVPGEKSSHPTGLIEMNGVLHFGAYDADVDHELWRTDGTAAGTVRAVDVVPGVGQSLPGFMTKLGGTVYFAANTNGSGDAADRELWKTDGTPAGTTRVADVAPGVLSSNPENFTTAGGRLFFVAADAGGDRELWSSDGTAAGTVELADANRAGVGSNPRPLGDVGGVLFFSAGVDTSFRELWKSDGTEAGTVRVGDVLTWAHAGAAVVGNTLFFPGFDAAGGWELWRTDGTAAGTRRLADTAPGLHNARVESITAVGDTVYFINGAAELWKTDGTEAGTVRVSDAVRPVGRLVGSGGSVYFGGHDAGEPGDAGALWRTDGTAGGTVRVGGPLPSELVDVNGTLYFRGQHPDLGVELWKSDGTAAGTAVVRDIFPVARDGTIPPKSSNPVFLTPFGNALLFFAQSDFTFNHRLWRTDGTAAGTYQIGPGTGQGGTNAVVGNAFYFTTHDNGLWKSDGYSASLVKYFDGSTPRIIGGAGGSVFFNHYTPATGAELWKSNGTSAGTAQVGELMPGGASSFPDAAMLVNGHTLFFAAEHPAAGRELWKLQLPAVAGRHVFYNGSAADGNDFAAGAADDAAVAAGKRALPPGAAATAANYTNYSRGINGVMVDIAALPDDVTLAAGDFAFRAFKAGGPAEGSAAVPPANVTVRRGAGVGGTDRVTLAWTAGAVRDGWLRVTVNAGERTGLSSPDVFFFGNLAGDTGTGAVGGAADAVRVDAADVIKTRLHLGTGGAAALDRYDFNRDGAVDVYDLVIARGAHRRAASLPPPPTATAAVAAAPAGAIAPATALRRPSRRDALIADVVLRQ